jgi:hypothetical protein
MSTKLNILTIHGMGPRPKNYAQPMLDEISRRLRDAGKSLNSVNFGTVYWADILANRDLQYLARARSDHKLDFMNLRQFVISALADAVAYRQTGQAGSTHQKIHNQVKNVLEQMELKEGADRAPLVIFAHSMGGQIIIEYIREIHENQDITKSPLLNMQTLAGMITFGSNIPLFCFAADPSLPPSFPSPKLSNALKAKARWYNFFDPDDILAYPLKPINDHWSQVVDKDITINTGNPLVSWNPVCHDYYWTDKDFTKPCAKFLATFL